MKRIARMSLLWVTIGLTIVFMLVSCASHKSWPPTPSLGYGVVIGKLSSSSHTNFPYTAQDLYLGRLIPAAQANQEPAVSFTYGEDPATTIHNSDGTFAFTDVAPGTYALLIWTPGNSFVIEAPEGGLIKVVIEKDKTTDLGTVVLK